MQDRGGRTHLFTGAPVIGAGFGLVIVLSAVAASTHGLEAFFSLGGLIIVVGGVISAAFMSYDGADVRQALAAIPAILKRPPVSQQDLRLALDGLVGWAHLTHEQGTRQLERVIRERPVNDPFVRYGLNMVISDYAPEDVRIMLKTAADAAYERDCVAVEVLRTMASHAPAFGMIGTLVGMVGMLYGLSEDIGSLGSTLAIAFLSTLYGVLTARMIYMPAASRLQQDIDRVDLRHQLITEAMVLLAARKSPMYLQDRLSGFLPPGSRDFYDVMAAGEAGTGQIAGGERARVRPWLKVVER